MWWLWILAGLMLLFGFVAFRGAPYVPTKKRDLMQAFDELYPLGEHDMLIDIGSGDGVVLREAARRGARAVGYELNPLLVLISRFLSRSQPGVTVHLADFWNVRLPKGATVVYTFGESRDIVRMAAKVESEATRLGRPLMFISYGFLVPGRVPLRKAGAHYLYRVEPLQGKKAQV